jgi:hypothetical protein
MHNRLRPASVGDGCRGGEWFENQRNEGEQTAMRFTVAAAAALTLIAMAATTAPAGVVISEDVAVTSQAGTKKSQQTVMIQGNKQKVVTPERVFITDLDAGKLYVLLLTKKTYAQLQIPPKGSVGTMFASDGLFLQYEKGSGTSKQGGYDCQNYAGAQTVGRLKLEATECVASAAPGAQEFVAFKKALAEQLKTSPLAGKGETADGIPMSSTLTRTFIPFPIPNGFSPEQVAQINAANAKNKPSIRKTEVTKIEVKDLPAATFVVPADFSQLGAPAIPRLPAPSAGASPAAASH